MCSGLVEMKVWMRLRRAGASACAARSMSWRPERASEQTIDSVTIFETSEMASKSPFDAMANPASMISTPMDSRSAAISSFSSSVIDAPGDCSPSRIVVSKILTCSRSSTWVIGLALLKR